jgi:acyl-CoA reductase-like NAD-dependent aldehyde dehydrogenase
MKTKKDLAKAIADFNKANTNWDKANADRDKAFADRSKAIADIDKANAAKHTKEEKLKEALRETGNTLDRVAYGGNKASRYPDPDETQSKLFKMLKEAKPEQPESESHKSGV